MNFSVILLMDKIKKIVKVGRVSSPIESSNRGILPFLNKSSWLYSLLVSAGARTQLPPI